MNNKKQTEEKSISEPLILINGFFKSSLFDLFQKMKLKKVVVLEGRPGIESSKHACRQLLKRKIDPVVISDNSAGFLFFNNLVKEVFISYQEGDKKGALCDIGSLILGVLGKRHKIPVKCYPAKKRDIFVGNEEELFDFNGNRVAPKNVKGYVPLMEWVPGKYITEILSVIK